MSAILEKAMADHYPERKAQADAADQARRLIGRQPDPILAGLTEAQVRQHHAMLEAMRAGELRPLPTCFGELS